VQVLSSVYSDLQARVRVIETLVAQSAGMRQQNLLTGETRRHYAPERPRFLRRD